MGVVDQDELTANDGLMGAFTAAPRRSDLADIDVAGKLIVLTGGGNERHVHSVQLGWFLGCKRDSDVEMTGVRWEWAVSGIGAPARPRGRHNDTRLWRRSSHLPNH